MWRRVLAMPVYDSRLAPLAAGIRGRGTGLSRLIFTAHGFEIDLQIRPGSAPGRFRLVGQVLNEEFEPTSGRVRLSGAFGTVDTELDACGHFSIDDLTASGHRLEIGVPDTLIEIPTVYL